jgi:hypothetical protein
MIPKRPIVPKAPNLQPLAAPNEPKKPKPSTIPEFLKNWPRWQRD